MPCHNVIYGFLKKTIKMILLKVLIFFTVSHFFGKLLEQKFDCRFIIIKR